MTDQKQTDTKAKPLIDLIPLFKVFKDVQDRERENTSAEKDLAGAIRHLVETAMFAEGYLSVSDREWLLSARLCKTVDAASHRREKTERFFAERGRSLPEWEQLKEASQKLADLTGETWKWCY